MINQKLLSLFKIAVYQPNFIASLMEKYGEDPSFADKVTGSNGEETLQIKSENKVLIGKFYGHMKLKEVDQSSSDYSNLISSLPDTWDKAKLKLESEVLRKSQDPVKAELILMGLREEDLVNKHVKAWLEDRYLKNKGSEIHPIGESVKTIKKYIDSKDAILNKVKADEGFKKELENRSFSEERLKDPLHLSVDDMVFILNQFEHGGETTIRTFGVEIKPEEKIGRVGEWTIWLPQSQETSAKIAGYDEVTKDPKTTWCTARTKGSNLFYHYISRGDIISFLFYIIRDNPMEARDWLSMGFIGNKSEGIESIKPVYGENGGITIDRDNVGLHESDFREILGKDYGTIFGIMRDKISELKGENPATKNLEHYAKDLSLFKKEFWNKSTEERVDFANIILKLNPIGEVRGFALAETDPVSLLLNFTNSFWAEPYIELAIKNLTEKNPLRFLLNFTNRPWASPYLDSTRKRLAERNPFAFLLDFSNKPWAEPYIDSAAKICVEKDTFDFLRSFSDQPWAVPYVDSAAERLADKDPYIFLERFINKSWAEPYIDSAAKRLAEKDPYSFLRHFSNLPCAAPYVDSVAERLAKEDPSNFLYTFDNKLWEEPWAEPYIELARENISKKDANPISSTASIHSAKIFKLSKALLSLGHLKEMRAAKSLVYK